MDESLKKEGDEISLADILRELRVWGKICKKNMLIVLLIAFSGGGLGYFYANQAIPTYKAGLKFIMKSDAGGLSSSLSSLSSLLGGTSSGGSSMEQIIELAGTDRIIGNTLLKTVAINDQQDLLINHFIAIENLKNKWLKDSILNKATFSANDHFETLNYAQRKAIKNITNSIRGSQGSILSTVFDKKTTVITISGVYKNEAFAIELVNGIYKELTDFYLDQTIYKTNNNVQILTKKVDSIRTVLAETQHSFAKNTDQSLGILLQKDKVESKSLAIKEQMLVLMYGEAHKNLETLKFMQASTAPSFTIIETPSTPIDPVGKSKMLYSLLGFCCFSFVTITFLRLWLLNENQGPLT